MYQNIMVLLIVAAAIVYLGWIARHTFTGRGGGCGSCGGKKTNDESPYGTQQPLISIAPLTEPKEKKPDPPPS